MQVFVLCLVFVCSLILDVNPVKAGDADSGSNRIRTLLVPVEESVISSQLSGRIISIKDQVGGYFKKSEILVSFDCTELNAKLAMAEAELEIAAVTLKVKQDLFKLQAAGETEVTLAVAAAAKAKSQVALQMSLQDSCKIIAPFDGSVVKVSGRAFQSVNQGQPLLEIVSSKSPKARFNVPSRWLSWIKPGVRFSLVVDENGKTYSGKVNNISARVDAVSQTVEVEGEIDAAAQLFAGMSGYATFRQQGKLR